MELIDIPAGSVNLPLAQNAPELGDRWSAELKSRWESVVRKAPLRATEGSVMISAPRDSENALPINPFRYGTARHRLGQDASDRLPSLVLDHAIEMKIDGAFRGGMDAHRAIWTARVPPSEALFQLSRNAILYGALLTSEPADKLTGRLYRFNQLPVTAFWRGRLLDSYDVKHWLGLSDATALTRELNAAWRPVPATQSNGWFAWRRRDKRFTPTIEQQGVYKLYISPRPEALPEVLAKVVPALATFDTPFFKVGSDLHAVLRPDKLVVYFSDRDGVLAAGKAMAALLADAPAQGVPFTAGFGKDAMVSWGFDPPAHARPNPVLASWRAWLSNLVANALVGVRSTAANPDEAVDFALHRVWAQRVDPYTWAPRPGVWSRIA